MEFKNVKTSVHPVILHKLTKLRDKDTTNKQFRELLSEITSFMGFAATEDFGLVDLPKSSPLAPFGGKKLKTKVALIPILRAGLGMVDAMLHIFPQADVYHIGMYRKAASVLPVLYYNKLPVEVKSDVAIILEPLIATGVTLSAVIDILKDWGVKRIKVLAVLAAKAGLEKLQQKHPDVIVHCVEIDEKITDIGRVIPGLGDIGDRQFKRIDEKVNGMEMS